MLEQRPDSASERSQSGGARSELGCSQEGTKVVRTRHFGVEMRMNNHTGDVLRQDAFPKSHTPNAPTPEGRALLGHSPYSLCCSELNRSVILVADRPPALVAVTLA